MSKTSSTDVPMDFCEKTEDTQPGLYNSIREIVPKAGFEPANSYENRS